MTPFAFAKALGTPLRCYLAIKSLAFVKSEKEEMKMVNYVCSMVVHIVVSALDFRSECQWCRGPVHCLCVVSLFPWLVCDFTYLPINVATHCFSSCKRHGKYFPEVLLIMLYKRLLLLLRDSPSIEKR